MNTTLRDELFEAGFNNSEINTILSLIASKMPEKKPKRSYAECCKDFRLMELALIESGFNQAIDSVKSILKGEERNDQNNQRNTLPKQR
jgi:hypothetical protein